MIPQVLLAALPLLVLVALMTKPRPLPAARAFAVAAGLAALIGAFAFSSPPALLAAAALAGLVEALTPILILFGALLFFAVLERTGALATLRHHLRRVSSDPVAQVMIAGFAFVFLVEAAAGFGTPAALAAPMLVALGFPALRVAALCLVFNTIPTAFGAAGTPLWFGFAALELSDEDLRALARKAAGFQTLAALVVPVVALRLLFGWDLILRRLGFVWLAVLACVLPMWLTARFSHEFPAIAGGVLGLPLTILLARLRIGLPGEPAAGPADEDEQEPPLPLWTAVRPLALVVGILLATRLPALGLRDALQSTEPALALSLGLLGEIRLSAAGVLGLRDLLGQGQGASLALLYVPFLLPFVLAAWLAARSRGEVGLLADCARTTLGKCARPALALFAALVFVKLFTTAAGDPPSLLLGRGLAEAAGGHWRQFAPLLGAVGSFFSGSTTISNLTFGPIQLAVAQETGQSVPLLLALQLSGAAMGNAICIHNIVAVCAVLSLTGAEGRILRLTLPPVLLFAVLLAVASWFF